MARNMFLSEIKKALDSLDKVYPTLNDPYRDYNPVKTTTLSVITSSVIKFAG